MQRAAHGRNVHIIKYIRTAHPHGLPVRGNIIRSQLIVLAGLYVVVPAAEATLAKGYTFSYVTCSSPFAACR